MSDCKLFYRLLVISCSQKDATSLRRGVLCLIEGLAGSLLLFIIGAMVVLFSLFLVLNTASRSLLRVSL